MAVMSWAREQFRRSRSRAGRDAGRRGGQGARVLYRRARHEGAGQARRARRARRLLVRRRRWRERPDPLRRRAGFPPREEGAPRGPGIGIDELAERSRRPARRGGTTTSKACAASSATTPSATASNSSKASPTGREPHLIPLECFRKSGNRFSEEKHEKQQKRARGFRQFEESRKNSSSRRANLGVVPPSGEKCDACASWPAAGNRVVVAPDHAINLFTGRRRPRISRIVVTNARSFQSPDCLRATPDSPTAAVTRNASRPSSRFVEDPASSKDIVSRRVSAAIRPSRCRAFHRCCNWRWLWSRSRISGRDAGPAA